MPAHITSLDCLPSRRVCGPGTQATRVHGAAGEAGFTLLESVISLAVLGVGLLGLAQAFFLGMQHISTSSANLVAREKAREAIESVHSARDTRTVTWAQIRNVSVGGMFLDGELDLNAAGDDGLINTADDAEAGIEQQRSPGQNGVLGDDDDELIPLTNFTRQVQILELDPVNPDLREVQITIRYTVGSQQRTYRLRTFISRFS